MNNLFLRIVSGVFLIPIVILAIHLNNPYYFFFLIIILILGLKEIIFLKNLSIKIIIFTLFIFFIYCCYQIRSYSNGDQYLYFLIIVSCLSDTGGYLFGKIFNGKKIKFISPNKTYSGFFGSLCFSQLTLIILNQMYIFSSFSNLKKFFLIFTFSFFVIFGDLLFSFFKRICKIKDYSNILPGHGGLLDRVDGLIISTIFLFFLIKFI